MQISRRTLLTGLGAACCTAAWPILTPVVFAAVPGANRLVVIILRGGLDGLGMVQPYGDPTFQSLRPGLAEQPGDGLTDLDGFFGLSRHFAALAPMWQAGELGFVHAVSTPYRDKRSHFDGQDILENGGNAASGNLTASRDGWLNRALELIPGAEVNYAMAVGREHLLILDGTHETGSWSPTTELTLADDELRLLSLLYAGDPLFAAALREADQLSALSGGMAGRAQRETGAVLAGFTADMLNGPSRIAAFSLGGWDTHGAQDRAIARPAAALAEALTTLRDRLGRNWENTAVVAMTEFGRTARQNGSKGTDHGTGGVMVLAGGALRGGKIYGDWPGLGEGNLFENRDLMPTGDVRRYAGWALAGLFGLRRSDLERTVFPGLDMGSDPGFIT